LTAAAAAAGAGGTNLQAYFQHIFQMMAASQVAAVQSHQHTATAAAAVKQEASQSAQHQLLAAKNLLSTLQGAGAPPAAAQGSVPSNGAIGHKTASGAQGGGSNPLQSLFSPLPAAFGGVNGIGGGETTGNGGTAGGANVEQVLCYTISYVVSLTETKGYIRYSVLISTFRSNNHL